MNHILDYTICNIFDIPSFFISKEYLCDCIKIKDCFGIFVTIKRSQEYKLQEFPYDIHGCIGKFNYPFNILSKDMLLESIVKCAQSAAYDDNRRDYFKNPLLLDSSATIELSFLILPSYDIDAYSGMITELSTIYNNDDFGIIAINEDDDKIITTATFLPKVFDINTPWNEIKTRLLEKGNIKTANFKTYTVHKYSKKIFDIINENYISKLFTNISSFFNKNYKDNNKNNNNNNR
jgi:AMMECR1 domain-containing protein